VNPLNPYGISQPVVSNPAAERAFISKVYAWMALALGITGLVATATASNEAFMADLMSGPFLMILIFAQLGVVFVLSLAVNRLSTGVATGLFILYSALTGLTFSMLFLIYTAESIGTVFFITAGTFALVSAYGFVTKTDLTKLGSLMFMGLIGIIIASLVNLFLQSDALYWIISYVGVVVFVGLIAYDTQRLKRMANGFAMQTVDGEERMVEVQSKAAVLGALSLYLNFINLFLMLLRIFGNRR
jgi:FtsH-binding integral membrane protein